MKDDMQQESTGGRYVHWALRAFDTKRFLSHWAAGPIRYLLFLVIPLVLKVFAGKGGLIAWGIVLGMVGIASLLQMPLLTEMPPTYGMGLLLTDFLIAIVLVLWVAYSINREQWQEYYSNVVGHLKKASTLSQAVKQLDKAVRPVAESVVDLPKYVRRLHKMGKEGDVDELRSLLSNPEGEKDPFPTPLKFLLLTGVFGLNEAMVKRFHALAQEAPADPSADISEIKVEMPFSLLLHAVGTCNLLLQAVCNMEDRDGGIDEWHIVHAALASKLMERVDGDSRMDDGEKEAFKSLLHGLLTEVKALLSDVENPKSPGHISALRAGSLLINPGVDEMAREAAFHIAEADFNHIYEQGLSLEERLKRFHALTKKVEEKVDEEDDDDGLFV